MIAMLENPRIRHLAQPLSVKGYHLLRDGALVTNPSPSFRRRPESSAVALALASRIRGNDGLMTNAALSIDGEKAALYATAEIPVYWLLDADARQLEIYPQSDGGVYRDIQRVNDVVTMPRGGTLELPALFAEAAV